MEPLAVVEQMELAERTGQVELRVHLAQMVVQELRELVEQMVQVVHHQQG